MRFARLFLGVSAALSALFGVVPSRTAAQTAPAKSSAVTTADGVLQFTANPDDGTVTVRDLLNHDTLSRSLVCPDPRGMTLTPDEVSLLVVCRGSRELAFLNTADFDVDARVAGVGSDASLVRISTNGFFAEVLGDSGKELSAVDLETRRVTESERRASLPAQSTRPSRPTRSRSVARPGRPDLPQPQPAATGLALPRGVLKNQLAFIGTIHGEHRTSRLFSPLVLRRLITAIGPDRILTEIPPNRLGRATEEFFATSSIAEPRVSRFPEYVDVLFPMLAYSGFHVIGTAAWNQPMDRYRRERLAAIEHDPKRAVAWAEYQAAIRASEAALARGGAPDDPHWIHTDAYDAAQRIQLDVYNRLFNDELGTGGWDTINKAHFANITRALEEHAGEGIRFLVMFGAGHKSWMLPRLRARTDLEILDVQKIFDGLVTERTPPKY